MKFKYLLPHKFKIVGGVLLFTGLTLLLVMYYGSVEIEWLSAKVPTFETYMLGSVDTGTKITDMHWEENNLTDETGIVIALVGALLFGFSKEREEDEYIYKLRSESLVWAVIINTIIIILATLVVYGPNYFDVLVYNMFTPLLIYILRFNFLLLKARRHEE